MKSFQLFLPQMACYQVHDLIDALNLIEPNHNNMTPVIKSEERFITSALQKDWQRLFCDSVQYSTHELPWTQLRTAQFSLPNTIKTVVCCDPVLMQLTHRGAYLLGQTTLNLSENDAIRIVAQINEQLMDPNEKLYMVDKYSWLLASEKTLELDSMSVNQLIGKDMFNHHYSGKHKSYWQQLTAEIQMLIKQMIDYQGLIAPSAENMINVHFSKPLQISNNKIADKHSIPFINNQTISLVTDNELFKTFAEKTFLSHLNSSEIFKIDGITEHAKPSDSNLIKGRSIIAIALDTEKETYPNLIAAWIDFCAKTNNVNNQIICHDGIITTQSKPTILTKLMRFFNR